MSQNTQPTGTPGTEMPVANETSATPPTPPPVPQESRPANPWNKAQLEELGKSERLCLLAMSETFKALFEANEFPTPRLTAFLEKIKTARNQTATAGQSNTAAEGATLDEAQAEQLLIDDIRKVQAKAKQKHARTNPVLLKDYLVGTNVTQNRAALEQHAQTVLNKLDSEKLSGLNTEFVQKMDEHRTTYVSINVTQGSKDAKAQEERMERDKQIEAIKDERIELQYVIDGEFAPSNPANAAVRRQFDLPPDRPFNAVKPKSS